MIRVLYLVLYKLFVCVFTQLLSSLFSFVLPSFLMFFSYLFTFLLVYFLTYLFTPSTIDPFRFQAGGHRKRLNQAVVFCVNLCCSLFCYYCIFCYGCMFVCVILSREIGWEERLQNDLFCVGWDVKP